MIRITFTYKKPKDALWFEEGCADNTDLMEMREYHLSLYNSIPNASLTITGDGLGEDSVEGWAVFEYPDEESVETANRDPKIVEFLDIVQQYYTDIGGTIEVTREELD
jgi:hypothetical protein